MADTAVADTAVVARAVARPAAARLPVPATLLCCAAAYAAFSQGAFYRPQALTFVALLVLAALAARGGRAGGVPGAAALVALWSVVSAALAGDVIGAAGPVLVVTCVAAAAVVVRRTRGTDRGYVVSALVAVGCCVAVLGWLGVALRAVPLSLVDGGLWRAASSITYANGTAGLLVPIALAAVARLVERRSGSVATALLLTGIAATLSRAGLLALAVGLVILTTRYGVRRTVAATWPAFAGAAVAFAGLLPTVPAAAPARPALAVTALAAGLVLAAAGPRLPARQAVAGGLAAVVLAVAFGAGAPVAAAAHHVAGERGTLASPDRAGEWSATWRAARTAPLTGVGPGNLRLAWTSPDGRTKRAHFTHNEYLQLLAEQGAVGLALVMALVAAVARAARGPAAYAALAALLVHSAFDFVWHIPLVPVAALVVVLASGPDREEAP